MKKQQKPKDTTTDPMEEETAQGDLETLEKESYINPADMNIEGEESENVKESKV